MGGVYSDGWSVQRWVECTVMGGVYSDGWSVQ